MAKDYIINLGYELWERGYALRNCSPAGEFDAYELYARLLDEDVINDVDDFIQWLFVNEPEMLYDEEAEARRYREENESKIRQYFAKYIEGRTWDKIDPSDWDFYSDWHKDVFGFRPHGIVCGEYVSPHR